MKKRITETNVYNLKYSGSGLASFYWDERLPGFGVRVSQRGKASYIIRHGRPHRTVTIGVVGELSFADAERHYHQLMGRSEEERAEEESGGDGRARLTFLDVLEHWENNHRSSRKDRLPIDDRNWRTHRKFLIKAPFAKKEIPNIKPAEVQAFLNQGWANKPSMYNSYKGRIRQIINYGQSLGWYQLAINPAGQGVRKRPTKKRNRALTDAELERLFEACEDYPHVFGKYMLFVFETACRPGEAADLEWKDVFLAHKRPHVIFRYTKSARDRTVPLSAKAIEILKAIRAETEATSGRVFRSIGARYEHGLVIQAKAGLEDIQVKDLRHARAKRLLREGWDIHDVSELLGHTDIRTTSIYLDARADHLLTLKL